MSLPQHQLYTEYTYSGCKEKISENFMNKFVYWLFLTGQEDLISWNFLKYFKKSCVLDCHKRNSLKLKKIKFPIKWKIELGIGLNDCFCKSGLSWFHALIAKNNFSNILIGNQIRGPWALMVKWVYYKNIFLDISLIISCRIVALRKKCAQTEELQWQP